MPNLEYSSNLLGESVPKNKSLGQLYVYYERLKNENHGANLQLYNNVKSSLNKIDSEYNGDYRIVNTLYNMSKAELNKELLLLEKIFGVKLSIDFFKAGMVKELIDALNLALNLKSVYERNLNFLKRKDTHLSVIQFFPNYFDRAWQEMSPQIISDIVAAIKGINSKAQYIPKVDSILTVQLPKVVDQAIKYMFESNEIKGIEDEHAYQELIAGINRFYNGGSSFSKQLYQLYSLDTIKEELLKSLEKNSKKSREKKLRGVDAKSVVHKNYFQNGGISLEYLENLTVNSLISKMPNAYGAAIHTGATGMKADNIIVFDINPQIINTTLANEIAGTREKNIKLIEGLGKKIKNLKDGFIIYSNVKNYSFTENFHGFSSGADISLNTYKMMMNNLPNKTGNNTFIGGIMQTLKGAIGENRRVDFEHRMAEDIAYFLFDDFETIGVPNVNDATAIHIFDLDGILVPLSFFLWLLARAIDYGIGNPNNIVKTTIHSGTIKYEEEQKRYTQEMWDAQGQEALDNIEIEVKFLRDFVDIMNSFMKS